MKRATVTDNARGVTATAGQKKAGGQVAKAKLTTTTNISTPYSKAKAPVGDKPQATPRAAAAAAPASGPAFRPAPIAAAASGEGGAAPTGKQYYIKYFGLMYCLLVHCGPVTPFACMFLLLLINSFLLFCSPSHSLCHIHPC